MLEIVPEAISFIVTMAMVVVGVMCVQSITATHTTIRHLDYCCMEVTIRDSYLARGNY